MKSIMIPMKTLLIAWNPYVAKDLIRGIELKVFLWNEEEIKKYDRRPPSADPYLSYACTDGSCCVGWAELTVDEITCECWRILLGYPSLDPRQALIEFSKIKEFEALRRMCFRTYFSYEYDGDYSQYLDDYFENTEKKEGES